MGLGPMFKSIGKEVAEKLQGDSIKPESLVPALKRGGTTEEELTFTNLGDVHPNNSGKVSKEAVIEQFKNNADDFNVEVLQGKDVGYGWVSPSSNPANASYKEKIVTFGADDRYTSGHWPEGPSNYLMHTRSQNDYVGGTRSRLVMEIQSDLHQQGRQHGYSKIQPEDIEELTNLHYKILDEARGEEASVYSAMRTVATQNVRGSDAELMKEFSSEQPEQYKRMLALVGEGPTEYYDIMAMLGRKAQEKGEANYNAAVSKYAKELSTFGIEASKEAVTQALMEADKIPKSPWEKTWLKKGLELELGDAVSSGLDNITVPIGKEAAKGLNRGQGVQKWYESNVVDTMKKIAKQQGATFELVDEAPVEVKAARQVLQAAQEKQPVSLDDINALKRIGIEIPENVNDVINLSEEKKALVSSIWDKRYNEITRLHYTGKPITELAKAANELIKQDLADAGIRDVDELYDLYSSIHAITRNLDYLKAAAKEDRSFARITMPRAMSTEVVDKTLLLESKINDVLDAANAMPDSVPFSSAVSSDPEISKLANELGIELTADTWQRDIDLKIMQANQIKKPSFTLYSVAPATVISAYAAKQQGYTDQELQAYLGEDYQEVSEQLPKVEQAIKAGYTEQEIMQFLGNAPTAIQSTKSDYAEPPFGPTARSEMIAGDYGKKLETMAKLTNTEQGMTLPEIVAALEVVYPNMRSVTLRTAGFFGNKDAQRMAEEATMASAQRIVNFVNEKYGVQVEYNADTGQYLVNGAEVTPGILDSITAQGAEATGAVTGGIAGAYLGKKYGGNWGAFLGSLGGAVIGSVAGTEVDYIRQAMELQADMHAEVAMHKALTAAEASVIGDMVGAGVFKVAGKSWQGIKRAKDFLVDGNSEGAYRALKDILHITDEEADEFVTRLQGVIQGEVPGATQAQKRITATLVQKPGAEFLVHAASRLEPRAATSVAASINKRAEMLNKYLTDVTPATTGEQTISDLKNYVGDVKNFYEGVKIQAASAPRAGNFSFNFDNIAINPVLEKLRNEITEPAQMERFVLQAQRIRGMSDARSFGDLLELRTIVNGFRRKQLTKATSEALDEVMTRIDKSIDIGANHILGPEADLWKANWQAAKVEYAKMKTLERNVLFKSLTRPGVSEDTVANQLIKYSTSIDGTFDDVLDKLPKKSRSNVERLMLDKLTQKYSVGTEGGTQAINLTELDKALDFIPFKDEGSRQMRQALHEVAEVFRNDPALIGLSKHIDIPKFQQALTDSIEGKIRYGVFSELYNAIRSRMPGEAGRNASLVRQAAKWLQQPLNMKEMNELMSMSADIVDIKPQAVQLQQEAAARLAAERDQEAVYIKLFGEGAVKKLKGLGESSRMPIHRIATQDIARQVAEQDGFSYTNVKELDYALKQRGYLGIMQGTDRVRSLK